MINSGQFIASVVQQRRIDEVRTYIDLNSAKARHHDQPADPTNDTSPLSHQTHVEDETRRQEPSPRPATDGGASDRPTRRQTVDFCQTLGGSDLAALDGDYDNVHRAGGITTPALL